MSVISGTDHVVQGNPALSSVDTERRSSILFHEPGLVSSIDNGSGSPTPYEQNVLDTMMSDFVADAMSDPAKLIGALHQAFGDKATDAQIIQLASRIVSGDTPMPTSVEFVNAGTLGANVSGVYIAENGGRILLDGSLLNDQAKLKRVFTEELGHHFDSVLGGRDSAGDEGAIFAELLQSGALDAARLKTLRAENDAGVITINGRTIAVEQFYGGTSVSSSGSSYSGPGSSPGAGGLQEPKTSTGTTPVYSGPGSSPAAGGLPKTSTVPTPVYTGPGSSPAAGGLPKTSTVPTPIYTGPGSSPAAGGLPKTSTVPTPIYTGPGSSPAAGGLKAALADYEYTGPGSSPGTGGLPDVSEVRSAEQREIDELDADVQEFIERSDAIYIDGPISVDDMQDFEAELAEFLEVDSIVDQQALDDLKDEDFASNGVDGLVHDLSPEAQTRLTALVIGMGPERIEAMTLLTDVGLRSEPANDGDTEKSAISFKDYLGGMLPVSLLVGRQVEIDYTLPPGPIAGTGNTATGAVATAASAAFELFPPSSSTGPLAAANVASNGLGVAFYAISVASVGHEIIDGEFFNSGNDTLEAISVVSGGIALVPGPWSIPAAGVSAASGIASIFVSETDMVDRPVDEMFSALDEQLTDLESELMQLREASSAEVDFLVGHQLGQVAGPLNPFAEPLDAFDQNIFERRLALEAQLGIPTDAELATAGLNRDRTNELIDIVSLNKVFNRLHDRAQAETWTPFSRQIIEVRDQRSDEIYTAIVPEHIQTDPWLVGPDLINDFDSAIVDLELVDAEIARVEQQYG